MDFYKSFIYFIIFIKAIFLILTLLLKYLDYKSKKNKEDIKKTKKYITIEYWRERSEFIFINCMSILLLYLFYPRHSVIKPLTYETKLLLFLYGLIILIQADWINFIQTNPLTL
jgi:hypothetical protein